MGRSASFGLLIAGCLIAFIGFNTDRLLGGSPGISTPQMMIIVGGVVLALVGLILSFQRVRSGLKRNGKQILMITIPTLLIMIVGLEIALTLAGFKTRYPTEPMPENFGAPEDWWICDSLGCHFEPIARARVCENNPQGRTCELNPQGFHDSDSFVQSPGLADASIRILMLGDSFTFGASASSGHSFGETLEARMPDAVVWNVSMPGAGTNQQAQWLEVFDPLLQPQLVIVGFYANDFEDNIFPLDSYYWGTTPDGSRLAIRKYRLDNAGNVTPITDTEDLYYRLHSVERPNNPVIRWMGKTRLGSLLLNTINAAAQIRSNQAGTRWQVQVDATRTELLRLRDFTNEHNIPLLMLMIPDFSDLSQPTQSYQTALELFDELDLVVLNPINLLSRESYNPPDVHWTNVGHEVVGEQLAACVQAFQETGELSDCVNAFENRVVP